MLKALLVLSSLAVHAYASSAQTVLDQHTLARTQPKLCDPSVQSYSGYIDITNDKHLFFWFFESRTSPSTAPLVLWLNGGPGCSSATSLLFELGPCLITPDANTRYNHHSFTSHANIIFLDQPVSTGFSYASKGASSVTTSEQAADDVYAFLQGFLERFPEYKGREVILGGESYGGMYVPHVGVRVVRGNREVERANARIKGSLDEEEEDSTSSWTWPWSSPPTPNTNPSHTHINLTSLILGNPLTDPLLQIPSMVDCVCAGPYALYPPDDPQCGKLKSRIPACERLIRGCYGAGNGWGRRAKCVAAEVWCGKRIVEGLLPPDSTLNPYDLRRTCDTLPPPSSSSSSSTTTTTSPPSEAPLCYTPLTHIETYMNASSTKVSLGVDPSVSFQACNQKVYDAFMWSGDAMQDAGELVGELVGAGEGGAVGAGEGVRVLVYAGNADLMCNYIGNERWVQSLAEKLFPSSSPFSSPSSSSSFSSSKSTSESNSNSAAKPWILDGTHRTAGQVRTFGPRGVLTFVNVYEAGHMAVHDQPEATLEMFEKWITHRPLV